MNLKYAFNLVRHCLVSPLAKSLAICSELVIIETALASKPRRCDRIPFTSGTLVPILTIQPML